MQERKSCVTDRSISPYFQVICHIFPFFYYVRFHASITYLESLPANSIMIALVAFNKITFSTQKTKTTSSQASLNLEY